MPEAFAKHWTRWLAVSAAVMAADLATKAWVSRAFVTGEVREVTPSITGRRCSWYVPATLGARI